MAKWKAYILGALFFLCASFISRGQNSYDEYLDLSYAYFSPAVLNSSNTPLNQFEFGISAGYGFELNEKQDQLSLGGGYEFFQLENDAELQNPLKVHATGVSLQYLKHLKNPSWAFTFSAGMAMISDYKTQAGSAYQTELMGMFHYGRSSNLIWTFGLLYSYQPFGPWAFPILGVDWIISDRLYFQTILFSNLNLEYQIKYQKLYAGLDIESAGQSFVLSNYQGEVDSYVTSYSEKFPYYPFDNTLFLDYYLNNGFVLYAKAGVRVSQEYVHYTMGHVPVEGSFYNSAISPSFTAKIGLAYRIRKF